jgi:hypothetical protein
MSCILRVCGEALDVDLMLSSNSTELDQVWRKGEPRSIKDKIHTDSGAQFVVSEADFEEFPVQRNDAISFLKANEIAIKKMADFTNVQYCVLDFGVSITDGNVAVMTYLSPELISLAASSGVGIEISCYLCSEDDD